MSVVVLLSVDGGLGNRETPPSFLVAAGFDELDFSGLEGLELDGTTLWAAGEMSLFLSLCLSL